MDTIFLNGTINTFDKADTVCNAVGVSGGRIAALGEESEVKRLATSRTQTVDLKGAHLFPGFMDSHNHLMDFGYFLMGIDLAGARRLDEIVALVKKRAEKTPAGAWIKGSRYAEYWLAENRHPTRRDLDAVSPDNPVILYHTSFHACTLNSLALAELGITRESKAPQGGVIEREEGTNEPTGVLHDASMAEVWSRLREAEIKTMTEAERIEMCSRATQHWAALGCVAATDAMVTPTTLKIYQETLAAKALKVRIYTMNLIDEIEPLVQAGIRTGFGCDMLKIGPVKIFEDGGMSNRTAAMTTPYLTPPYDKGLKVLTREEMIEASLRYTGLGYQISVHSQGDDGLADTLDAFEAALGKQSDNPLRLRIEHAGCLFPHLLKRAAAMNIAVSSQPAFFSALGDGYTEAFGEETAHKLYPYRNMLNAGIPLGFSSDCPVISQDPRLGLRDAVLRRTPSGKTLGADQALTVDEALRLYTRGSAYLSFEENKAGTVEIGKRADFTVLGEDPRRVDVEEIPDIPVALTVVGGEIVHEG